MSTEEIELLPCPFCGHKGQYGMISNWHYVCCKNQECPAVVNTPYRPTKDEAVKAWNTRAT